MDKREHKIRNRILWIDKIHFNIERQVNTERVLEKIYFDVAEGTKV